MKRLFKKKVLGIFLFSILIFTVGCSNTSNTGSEVNIEDYPSKQINMILPWAPGGSGDNTARPIADRLSELMDANISLESREGGSGAVGTGEVVRSEADGYTLLNGGSLSTVVNTPLTTDTGYTLDDLIPIAQLTSVALVLATNEDSSIENLDDLVEQAKEQPGELKVSTPGATSTQNIAISEFMSLTGIEMELVPYDGSSPAYNALLNGEVDLWMGVESEMLGKELKLLGVSSPERLDVIPDTPTFKEQGFEEYEFVSGFGVFAPKGTPQEIIDILEENIKEAHEDPDVQSAWEQAGLTPHFLSSEDYSEELERQLEISSNILEELGLLNN